MAYITDFKRHKADLICPQDKTIEWLQQYCGETKAADIQKYAVSSNFINSRLAYAPGIANQTERSPLYPKLDIGQPTISARSEIAQETIDSIFADLYREVLDAPDAINHISCTHYQSPSAVQKTIVNREWYDKTIATHLYHMGCYAALPALRVSQSYINSGMLRVDNVHTELCSFHLDRDNLTPEQIIMNTLFADGAIKYSVVDKASFEKSTHSGFEIMGLKEMLVPGTEKEMSWKLSEHGFAMTLTKNVPLFLAKRIESFFESLFEKNGLNFQEEKDDLLFAIHPGGPKIIELIQRVLQLKACQIEHSKTILSNRGNMSSATLPYIWDEIIGDPSQKHGQKVATIAFGPGLTMTGGILKLCRR